MAWYVRRSQNEKNAHCRLDFVIDRSVFPCWPIEIALHKMSSEDSKPTVSCTGPQDGKPNGPATMSRHLVYGSIATPIKKPDSDHTHKWTVYVRGFHEENISSYIKRVVFRLHDSFPNPSRCVAYNII